MSIYVDRANIRFGWMIMCHMIADTHDELMHMVERIGVQKKWIQNKGTAKEHFDISVTKRKLAIKHGAIEITSKELVQKINERT